MNPLGTARLDQVNTVYEKSYLSPWYEIFTIRIKIDHRELSAAIIGRKAKNSISLGGENPLHVGQDTDVG